MSEEKRIYVVVAEQVEAYVESIGITYMVTQPAGRLAAQCAHVVSKARIREILQNKCAPDKFEPVTTIILSARNSKELVILRALLADASIDQEQFFDTNEEAYHGADPVLTAICTHPIHPAAVDGILDHLPLWSPKCA